MTKDTNRYGRGCDNDEHNRIQHEIFCGMVSRQKEKFSKQNDQYHECDLQNRHIYVPLHRPVPSNPFIWGNKSAIDIAIKSMFPVCLNLFSLLLRGYCAPRCNHKRSSRKQTHYANVSEDMIVCKPVDTLKNKYHQIQKYSGQDKTFHPFLHRFSSFVDAPFQNAHKKCNGNRYDLESTHDVEKKGLIAHIPQF
jgi:hypothetical protein